MALRARCLSIGSLRRWRSLERGWRSGLMRLYAEMACARPANVGPRLATLICSASTFRRPFNSQAAQQSRLEEEGSASVNKLATALRYPAVSAPLALQSGGAALSSTSFGGQCTGSTSRVDMGAVEQCPKGSVRCDVNKAGNAPP